MSEKIFSFGNKKLPKTTAIFNITPALGCPANAKGLCQLKNPDRECYAMNPERMYPTVMPYRKRQARFWRKSTVIEFTNRMEKEIGRRKITALRLNESGDFRHQEDVNKAIEIAKILKLVYNMSMYCYTARRDLDFSKREAFVVTGSGFMVDNHFQIIYNKEDMIKGNPICPQDCRICNLCLQPKNNLIYVTKH